MTRILFLCVYTALFAVVQAMAHKELISNGRMRPAVKVAWTLLWLAAVSPACFAGLHFPASLLLLLGLRALFSLVFRHVLAELMGWPSGYIGTTALYDRFLRSMWGAYAARAANIIEGVSAALLIAGAAILQSRLN